MKKTRRREAHWPPHSKHKFKLNIDATINIETRTIGIGAIIRNARVKFRRSFQKDKCPFVLGVAKLKVVDIAVN